MPAPRILLVKTSSLGDVIHALPVATDIARALPGAEIDWVVEENFADIPMLHPAVGKVIRSAVRRWRKTPFSSATRRDFLAFQHLLREESYDHVIDLQGLIKSALITLQAHGPGSGFNRASAREGLACLAYRHCYPIARAQHAVTRNRQLAAAALGYSLTDLPLDYGLGSKPDHLQKKHPDAAFAILITATSRDDKLWPDADWIELGRALQARGIQALLPAGSAAERQRAERIAGEIPAAAVLPPAAVAGLAQSFSGAVLAVGVDTGLTHLACALGIPTLALYTATDPGLTGVIGSGLTRNLGGAGTPPSLADVLAASTQVLA